MTPVRPLAGCSGICKYTGALTPSWCLYTASRGKAHAEPASPRYEEVPPAGAWPPELTAQVSYRENAGGIFCLQRGSVGKTFK